MAGVNVILYIAGVLEGELLPLNLVHDALAVVITETAAQLVVVHTRLVLPRTPQLGNLLRLEDAKLVAVARARPVNQVLLVGREEEV